MTYRAILKINTLSRSVKHMACGLDWTWRCCSTLPTGLLVSYWKLGKKQAGGWDLLQSSGPLDPGGYSHGGGGAGGREDRGGLSKGSADTAPVAVQLFNPATAVRPLPLPELDSHLRTCHSYHWTCHCYICWFHEFSSGVAPGLGKEITHLLV